MTTKLASDKIFLSKLTENHPTEAYLSWLCNPAINQYLESRHLEHTIESCKKYINDCNISNKDYLFGIFAKDTNIHIGNIKITITNKLYQVGEVGLIVGEENYWGQGIGTTAISLITEFGFNELQLKKIEAGCYEKNLGSLSCFLKCGYSVEGFIRNSVEFNGKRMSLFRLGIIAPN